MYYSFHHRLHGILSNNSCSLWNRYSLTNVSRASVRASLCRRISSIRWFVVSMSIVSIASWKFASRSSDSTARVSGVSRGTVLCAPTRLSPFTFTSFPSSSYTNSTPKCLCSTSKTSVFRKGLRRKLSVPIERASACSSSNELAVTAMIIVGNWELETDRWKLADPNPSFEFRVSNLFDCVVAVHDRHPQIHPDEMWDPVLPDIKRFLSAFEIVHRFVLIGSTHSCNRSNR
jgi:hypothetical protein